MLVKVFQIVEFTDVLFKFWCKIFIIRIVLIFLLSWPLPQKILNFFCFKISFDCVNILFIKLINWVGVVVASCSKVDCREKWRTASSEILTKTLRGPKDPKLQSLGPEVTIKYKTEALNDCYVLIQESWPRIRTWPWSEEFGKESKYSYKILNTNGYYTSPM